METEQPNPPKPRRKKLTIRQSNLVKNLAAGMPQAKAAIKAGYSPNGAKQTAQNTLEALKKTAPSILERAGLTDELLAAKYLLPALSQTEQRTAFAEGQFYYSKPMPDMTARLKALDLAFRISGSYKSDQNPGALKVQVVVLSADHRPVLDIPTNGNGTSSS